MKPKDYFYDHPATGPGHFGQVFVSWFFVLVRVVFKLFRFKVVGRRAIQDFKAAQAQLEPKERRNLIIAGNHESYLDPLFVISAIRPDIVRFIVKDDFMDYPVAGRLVAYSGGFPIKRNSADMQAVKRACAMLKRGETVGIFPEGTRVHKHPDKRIEPADGIALIAQLGHADVLPFRLWGNERIVPYGAHFLHLPKVTLKFGQPLSLNEPRYQALPKNERYAAFTKDVMAAIYGMEL